MIKFGLLSCLFIVPLGVLAGDRLTIADATREVLSMHPAASALQAQIDAATALRKQAGYRPNPEASFGAGYKDADVDSGYEAEASLVFPIERKGKREARLGIAESDQQIAEAELAGLRRDISLQVRTLAYEYLTASVDAEIAGEIAERSRVMIELLRQRPAAGPAILLELKVIEASLVEFQKSAREFNAQRDIARRSLNLLLGRDPDTLLEITDTLSVPSVSYELSDLEKGLARNPAQIKRLAEVQRAIYEAETARMEAKPDMSVGPYVAYEELDGSETTLGVAFSIPLMWRNRNQGAIAAAEATIIAVEARAAADLNAAKLEAVRIHRMYEAAVEQANAIPPEQVEALHDAADLADRQYRLGAIPVQLFLEVQREFLSVQLLRHNALLEALKNEAVLQWLTGNIAGEEQP